MFGNERSIGCFFMPTEQHACPAMPTHWWVLEEEKKNSNSL